MRGILQHPMQLDTLNSRSVDPATRCYSIFFASARLESNLMAGIA